MINDISASLKAMAKRYKLSHRELQVLTLYAQGHTQKSVSARLFISPGTTHTHIKRIYRKTGLHSRQDVIDYLQEYAV